LVSPLDCDVRIEPQENMQVVIENRETANADGKVLGEQLQSIFDPLFAVLDSLAEQESASNAFADAVIKSRNLGIDNFFACSGHGVSPILIEG